MAKEKEKRNKHKQKKQSEREHKNKKDEVSNDEIRVEISGNGDKYKTQLDFAQRKDRFLIVTTIVGVLILVLRFLKQVCVDAFDKFYLHNINVFGIENLFISGEQIILILYFSSFIYIIGVFLIYCVFELCNLQSTESNFRMEADADKWYGLVFKIALTLLLSNSIISMLVMFMFSDDRLGFWFVVIMSGVGIFWGLIIDKKKKEKSSYNVSSIIKTILGNCTLSFFLFLILFIGTHNERGTLTMYFDNENVTLEFNGNCYPEEVKCTLEGEKGRKEANYLFDYYGEYAWIEKVSSTVKGKDDNTSVRGNYYYYKYLINIADMHDGGSNKIALTFEIGNTEYRINNMFYYSDGEYVYTEELMQTDL